MTGQAAPSMFPALSTCAYMHHRVKVMPSWLLDTCYHLAAHTKVEGQHTSSPSTTIISKLSIKEEHPEDHGSVRTKLLSSKHCVKCMADKQPANPKKRATRGLQQTTVRTLETSMAGAVVTRAQATGAKSGHSLAISPDTSAHAQLAVRVSRGQKMTGGNVKDGQAGL